MIPPPELMNAASMRRHLDTLYCEQAAAGLSGLLQIGSYRSDLDEEIAYMRNAYVGAAVTEIATLRGQFDGPLRG